MRVAYVTMRFPVPSEAFAGTDVRVLRNAGVDVDVFTMRPKHRDHERLLQERGLERLRVRTLTPAELLYGSAQMISRLHWLVVLVQWLLRWHLFRPYAFLRCLPLIPSAMAIASRIAKGNYDVVHLFWGHYPSMVGLLVQRFMPDVVSSMFLGAYDLDVGSRWLPGAAPVARGADVVWTHSQSNLCRLRALGISDKRLRCVYRGVDLRNFPPSDNTARADGLVVTIGSLTKRKGVDDAIRVISRVRRSVPNIRLDVFGEGPEEPSLRALASALQVSDRVVFRGHTRSETIAAALRAASAFILMSRSDRIPNVVKEAMASGCPCVVTDTQGMDELVVHGETGYRVPVGDIEAAAHYVTEALLNPDQQANILTAARNRVVQRFSADAAMAEYVREWSAARTTRPGILLGDDRTHRSP